MSSRHWHLRTPLQIRLLAGQLARVHVGCRRHHGTSEPQDLEPIDFYVRGTLSDSAQRAPRNHATRESHGAAIDDGPSNRCTGPVHGSHMSLESYESLPHRHFLLRPLLSPRARPPSAARSRSRTRTNGPGIGTQRVASNHRLVPEAVRFGPTGCRRRSDHR